jgi:tellurite resistance protein TerC
MDSIEYPIWVWTVFFSVVFIALFVDLGIANRRSHAPTRKETVAWTFVWISLAAAFNAFIYSQFGGFKGKEFLTGYLIELSLSVDNLFVFLLIFSYFRVPKQFQHRTLFWGIFMALVMRMVMIFAGAQLVESFSWVLYFFGFFLIYTGFRMFGDSQAFEPEDSSIIKLTTRIVPISKQYDGENFFVTIGGKRTGTMLLLVLLVINIADIVFAVDSIPAIFGITTDRFIVYTSNIFAILGLRTFYFLLADMADRFHYLKYGLAFVLSFIGVKMLLPLFADGMIMLIGTNSGSELVGFLQRFLHHEYEQAVINLSLGVVAGAIALSVIVSLIIPQENATAAEEE